MQKKFTESHQFALFYSDLVIALKNHRIDDLFTIDSDEMVNRIAKILRLQTGENFILFDRIIHAQVEIIEISKRSISVRMSKKEMNEVFQPTIQFLLPVLKKEAFHEALYALTEMGVQEIQLIITQKTHRDWHAKEMERAQRVCIAAAEQSKNFAFPIIHPPLSLSAVLEKDFSQGHKLFFDPQGIKLSALMPILQKNSSESITLMVGPEGDVTPTEKEQLKKAGFVFCALTPTILRACQAASLSAGVIRSYFNQ